MRGGTWGVWFAWPVLPHWLVCLSLRAWASFTSPHEDPSVLVYCACRGRMPCIVGITCIVCRDAPCHASCALVPCATHRWGCTMARWPPFSPGMHYGRTMHHGTMASLQPWASCTQARGHASPHLTSLLITPHLISSHHITSPHNSSCHSTSHHHRGRPSCHGASCAHHACQG